jgi:hypothetical protein
LPDLLDVKKYVEYEAEPNSVLVLQEESGQEKFNVVISPDNKIISDGGLISYITNINKNHNS